VQIAVALYMCWAGFRIEQIHLVGGVILPLGVFGVVVDGDLESSRMNALNLIECLDGLARASRRVPSPPTSSLRRLVTSR